MLGGIILSLAAAVAAPVERRPVGPWSVEYAPNMCLLSRGFGGTTQAPDMMLVLRPLPLSTRAEMAVAVASSGSTLPRNGKVTVTLLPSRVQQTIPFVRRRDETTRRDVTSFDVAADFLEAMRSAEAIELASGGQPPVRLATGTTAKAFAALVPCQDDLLKSWGYDPAIKDAIATPAQPVGGSFGTFFGRDYYPAEALRQNQQGRVTVAWTIDQSGKARDCRILGSSGVRDLDLTTCAIILQKVRFKPALDQKGDPMASYQTLAVRWSLDN